MIVSHEILDLAAYIEREQQPASVFTRGSSELWLVRDEPLLTGTAGAKVWAWVNAGEYVRIPLYPYRGLHNDPAALSAFVWQLGFLARDEIGDVGEILKLHLVIGSPLEALSDPGSGAPAGYRLWLGFGACVVGREPPGG